MLRLAALLAERFEGGAGVLLQLRGRGERGGAQDRAQGDRAERGSSHSRAASTGARSARSRRPGSPRSGRGSARSSRASRSRRPNDIESLEAALAPAADTALVLLEPVLGEGGVIPLEPAFVAGCGRARARGRRASLRRRGADRAWGGRDRSSPTSSSGSGPTSSPSPRASRTACRWARCSQASARRPGFVPGDHGSTFGGNPVVAAAACAVVEAIDDELLAARSGARRPARRRPRGAARRRVGPRPRAARRRRARPPGRPGRRCVPRARGLLVLSAGPDVLAADAAARRQRRRGRAGARDHRDGARRREPPGAPGRDPPARPGQGALDPGRARPGAQGRGPRRRADDGLARRDGARARQGARAERPADLCRPGHGRRRPAARDRGGDAPLRDGRRGGEQRPRRRHDALRATRARSRRRSTKAAIRRSPGRSPATTRSSSRPRTGRPPRELHAELARPPRGRGRRDDALVGPGRRLARSRGVGVPARRRRGAPPVRLRGELPARAAAARGRPALGRRARRGGVAAGRDRPGPGGLSRTRTRTSTARSSAGSASSAARSTPGARATTRSQRRSGSTSSMRAPRPARRSRRSRSSCSRSPRRRPTRCCPGYTHLQRGQPVTLGHHLLAWVEMLDRDRTRFAAAAAAAAESPLGAGALAGSTLGPPAPAGQMRNSIDAVADRDFALDYLYAVAVLYTHLSRIGEEIVLWSSAEFGFARLPENAATGSSMMPQKLNPDVAELARGKAGTAIGRLTGLLATVKGLPLAYDRDLQEDKAPVFAAGPDTRLGLAGADRAVRRARGRPRADGRGRVRSARARNRRRRSARARRRPLPRGARAVRRACATARSPGSAAESVAARGAPGPGGVREALAEARSTRIDATPVRAERAQVVPTP